MKKILFNGLGNRGWIGGLYYLKNIIFSCLESEKIKKEYRIVVLIDSAHADIFTCFGNRIDLHIYDGTNKAKLALYEMNLIWLHGVKYCYALELNKIGSLFASRGIFWIPDFQHKTLPEFFQPEELARKDVTDRKMTELPNTLVLSSEDARHDLERFYPQHKCKTQVVHFVSYIEPELCTITPELERDVADKFGLHKKYVYLPNQFWKHKNHELKAIMEAEPVAGSIRLLGFVERTEQLCIMKNAAFIVQPSLCEGWGTVLEDAKVLDKAVLLSDIPVHREQKNEKCTLFDPHDPDALADLIVATAEKADRPEEAAYFAGDMMAGMANMYREAGEYAKALEKIFV